MNRSKPIIFRPSSTLLAAAAILASGPVAGTASAQVAPTWAPSMETAVSTETATPTAAAERATQAPAPTGAPAADPVPSRRSVSSGIDFVMTGNGRFGFDSAAPHSGFIAPRGSGKAYIYGSGLWFGVMRRFPEGDRPLVFSTYNPATGWSNATPGDTGGPGLPVVFHSADYDLLGNPLRPVERWPLWLEQGVGTVQMMYPGTYVPDTLRRNRDAYPGGAAFATRAREQMVTRYHDRNLASYEDGPEVAAEQGYPLGLQIQQSVYAWDREPLRQSVIVQYQIVNVSRDTLHGCVIGHVTDPDIGTGENDHLTRTQLDPSRRTILGWSDPDQGDSSHGTLATMLVEAPVIGSDGYVRAGDRQRFRLNGALGVFSRWVGDAGIATTKDRYDAMTLPDWSADTDSGAADQRMVIASDTFSFRPGDTAYFAVGYAVLDGILGKRSSGASVGHQVQGEAPRLSTADLEWVIYELYKAYYTASDPAAVAIGSGDASLADAGISLVPNPAGERATLGFSLSRQERATLRIVDRLGRDVLVSDLGMLAAGAHRHTIDLSALEPGAYLASVETGTTRRAVPLVVLR